MKKQKQWVIAQLTEHGEVSRNQALSVYVSRLGAIIHTLKSEGWNFETFTRDGNYVYRVIKAPTVESVRLPRYTRNPLTGERISTEAYAAL